MKSVFFQLMLLQVACGVLIAAVLGALSERSFTESIYRGFEMNGRTVAESIAKSLELPLANRETALVQSALDASLQIPNVEWAYVTSPDGRVLADTFVPMFPDYLPRFGSEAAAHQIQMAGTNESVLLITQPVMDGIFGAVHIGLGEEKLIASIIHIKTIIAATLGLTMFLLIVIVGVVTRRIVAPIRSLTQASLAMAADLTGDFRPLEVSSSNEIGALTLSFNRMILERQEYRKNLENRVLERTQDLFNANQELGHAMTVAKEASEALRKANEELKEEAAERKLLEGQLVQAQKLESIGQLASGIAHEINTPIQYIGDNCLFLKTSFAEFGALLGQYVEIVALSKASEPDRALIKKLEADVAGIDAAFLVDEIPKAIEQSIEGLDRVSQIVRAMKEFSHPGSVDKSPVDLNHAIANTLAVCRNEVKNVATVVTDFDHSLPPVYCLIGEMNQVILNLVVNAAHAIEASRKDGTKGTIEVTTRLDGAFVEIRVRDNGGGIPAAIRSRIFDPFFTTKEVGKGTGQGLAIARSAIVKKHGGTLTFETEENWGTTFIVRIPWAAGGEQDSEPEKRIVLAETSHNSADFAKSL